MTDQKEMFAAPIAIRLAMESDLDAINEIYNHYVRQSTCTYQEEPETIEARREWFAEHDVQHPVTVAELNGQAVGWGALSTYHPRSAYRRTVENSLYLRHDQHRRGIGSMLLQDLITRAKESGHKVIIAGIDSEQTASVALHTKFDFQKVGHFKQVGFKFARWLDVVYMELVL